MLTTPQMQWTVRIRLDFAFASLLVTAIATGTLTVISHSSVLAAMSHLWQANNNNNNKNKDKNENDNDNDNNKVSRTQTPNPAMKHERTQVRYTHTDDGCTHGCTGGLTRRVNLMTTTTHQQQSVKQFATSSISQCNHSTVAANCLNSHQARKTNHQLVFPVPTRTYLWQQHLLLRMVLLGLKSNCHSLEPRKIASTVEQMDCQQTIHAASRDWKLLAHL